MTSFTLPCRGRVGARSAPGWGKASRVTEPAMRRTIDSFRRDAARRLRANATNAEKILWRHLRRSPIHGTHFRRQVLIGPYIADFACMAARLVIEIDGSQHAEGAVAETDKVRTRWLEAEGYRVLRFWSNDITQNIEGVLEALHHGVSQALGYVGALQDE